MPVIRRGYRISRLRRLGFRSYRDYLHSPVWASVKDAYRASDRPQVCVYCDEPRVQIHHLTYERVGGDELLTDLVALCGSCHALVHVLERTRQVRLSATADLADEQRATAHRQAAEAAEAGRADAHDALIATFQRRPVHRRLAALMAFNAAHDLGPWKRVDLRRELRIVDQRLGRALGKVERGRYPGNDLRVIDETILKMIAKLEHDQSAGSIVVTELLAIA